MSLIDTPSAPSPKGDGDEDIGSALDVARRRGGQNLIIVVGCAKARNCAGLRRSQTCPSRGSGG